MSQAAFSRFSVNPVTVEAKRSSWMTPFHHKTTFNAGRLIPVAWWDCLPGDSFSLEHSVFMRMSTPIHPVLDDCYLDLHYYFVPWRLIFDDYDKFFGANDDPWTQTDEILLPHLHIPHSEVGNPYYEKHGFDFKSVADYLGVPPDQGSLEETGELEGSEHIRPHTVCALPFRAYCKIWNDWYRDENLMPAIDIHTDSLDRDGSLLTGNPFLSAQYGGDLLPVCKYHDYFTSSLPSPQRHEDIVIPMGDNIIPTVSTGPLYLKGQSAGTGNFSSVQRIAAGSDQSLIGGGASSTYPWRFDATLSYSDGIGLDESELHGPTINQLRQAFALQRMFEIDALYGTRYNEFVRGHFGVTVPDYRIARSEYIGGRHITVNMSQVLQTSSTDATSPQGNTAAFSATGDRNHVFTYSCVEHGIIMACAMVRNAQSYQQGLPRAFSRRRRFDVYHPELAYLGNQPVYKKEIFLQNGYDLEDPKGENGDIFGYQEAWADYRYIPNRVSSAFRSTYPQTLDSWHYSDYYLGAPTLSPEWIQATPANIDRTIAVQSQLEDQFIADFGFNLKMVRVMPPYSMGATLAHH